MPLSGSREIASLLVHTPQMDSLATEPLELPRAVILHLMFEIRSGNMVELLPKALHPTIPPTVTFIIGSYPEGPAGAFNLAQVRIGCRAGVRPRGLLLAAYCDNDRAAEMLRSRWGFACRSGTVRLRHQHDRAVGTVEAGGKTILDVQLIDPEYISGGDVQYTANMNLARVKRDGDVQPKLVQVDPEFTFHRAQRGHPQLAAFDHAAWGAEGVEPVYPVSATISTCDVILPRLRYIMNPDLPAMQGTESLVVAAPKSG